MSTFQRVAQLRKAVVEIAKAGLDVESKDDPKYGIHAHEIAGQHIGHTVNVLGQGWTAVPTNGNIKGKFKDHEAAKQFLADQHGEGIKTEGLVQQQAEKAAVDKTKGQAGGVKKMEHMITRQRAIEVLTGIAPTAEDMTALTKVEPHKLIKADNPAAQASGQAQDASSQAWQASAPTQAPTPPPAADQIKAHKAAAKAHGAAAAAHREQGKSHMQAAPQVGQAHFQQAQSHDSSANYHAQQAQSMQDEKDQGYRS